MPETGTAESAVVAPAATGGTAERATLANAGLGLLTLGSLLVLLLHVLPPSSQINPMARTISEYALGANGWMFDVGVLALAAGSMLVLAGLVRAGVVRALSGSSVFVTLWSAALAVLVFFEKYDFANGEHTGASGMIHRLASLVAFLSLPTAALLASRGAARRNPRRMRPSRSASAWNLTRIARPLELRNQFGVGLSRLPVLNLSGALSFGEVRIDFFLVREVKCKSSVHLLECQGRIALDHALRRHPFAEKINQGIEGHAGVRDPVCAFVAVYVFLRHQTHSHTPTTRRATPLVVIAQKFRPDTRRSAN